MSRICFISLSAYGYFAADAPAGGGAQRQFYLLSTNLASEFDVQFVVGDYGQAETEHREGVTLHRAYAPDGSASVGTRCRQVHRLFDALRQAAADVYIIRCPPPKLTFIYPLVRALRRPLIYHIAHDSFVEREPYGVDGIRKRAYVAILRHVAAVVAQTAHQSEQVTAHWGIDATVVPNGYPTASVVDRHTHRKNFIWVGRLSNTSKRPHLFLDVAAELPGYEFLLIGPPGTDTEYASRVIGRAEEAENVTYIGQVPPDEIHRYYRQAIAVVNTASAEGFPNTFLEAWRYATPVLSLAVDPSRFLGPDVETTAYASESLDSLVKLVRTAGRSHEYRREVGIQGLKAFEQQYHINQTVSAYERVIRSVVEST